MIQTHEKLFKQVCPGYMNYLDILSKGKSTVDVLGWDCSSCRYFMDFSKYCDWGCCVNRTSARGGMITFEHQGCKQYKKE